MIRRPRLRMRFGLKLFLSHFMAVLLVSGSIGSSCKKIRDDKGYWQQVEQFVSFHTGAQFSHGLCPTCATELYGEVLMRKTPVRE
jgi:hypothetical protein